MVDLVVLRVPAIYGPARLGIDRILASVPVVSEKEALPGNRIHVDDLVRTCLAATESDCCPGTYNVCDGDHRSTTWFSLEVARQYGVAAPPEVTMAVAKRVFSRRRLSFPSESRIVDSAKMRAVLEVIPEFTNAADGIRASLDEMRSQQPRIE